MQSRSFVCCTASSCQLDVAVEVQKMINVIFDLISRPSSHPGSIMFICWLKFPRVEECNFQTDLLWHLCYVLSAVRHLNVSILKWGWSGFLYWSEVAQCFHTYWSEFIKTLLPGKMELISHHILEAFVLFMSISYLLFKVWVRSLNKEPWWIQICQHPS